MVGIVLVSHSRALALAVKELAATMTGPKLRLAVAAGVGEQRAELGTDAMEILEAIQEVMSEEGVLVLMDMGSALLSTETSLGFLDESQQKKVRCSAAPFIEGAVAASVVASLGSSLDEVAREAEGALRQKGEHLQPAKTEPADPPSPAKSGVARSVRVVVRNPHGLHARPAARLIQEAARFSSTIEVRNVTGQRGPASIKSLTGLATLQIQQGQEIEFTADGADADSALQALVSAVKSGLGEAVSDDAPASAPVSQHGVVGVSAGIAIGPLFWSTASEVKLPEHSAKDIDLEVQTLRSAIEKARADLSREEAALVASSGKDAAAILQAQALLLDDPAILQAAEGAIRQSQDNAPRAWHRAYEDAAATYEKLEDEYLRQRSADLRDVGRRVLANLGIERHRIGDLPQPGILVVDDLAPTDVAGLSKNSVLGVICLRGGKTSHAAILLRARGMPAIARAQHEFESARLGPSSGEVLAAIDGDQGKLWLAPNAPTLQTLLDLAHRQGELAATEAQHRHERAETHDGHPVAVWANLGQPAEAETAVEQGAEGVGLFRTEFLFLHREKAPTEEEQFQALRAVQQAMEQRPVIIRTLDIGGDKELPYLKLPREENPFLGIRGIRLCLKHPELFEPHLRAILRAGYGGNFRLMFPMIADSAELAQARRILESVQHALAAEGVPHAWPIPVGIMIEVPSAVALIEQLAPLVDFLSIGTNDLTQYVLAADRGNPELAHFQDALHPAVLRQIQQVVAAAHRHGKEVGICGEAAADPDAACIFIGLGVDELSLSPARIPKIKATIRAFSRPDAEALAAKALTLSTAAEVRALIAEGKL